MYSTRSIQILKSFNDKLDSIDTHIKNSLGTELQTPDGLFIQQIVYGVQVESKVLNTFISNLYADNAASVARSDILFYTVFAYLAIFRLKELGFHKFKELSSSQDPTKIYNLTSYLYNKEVLWSSLRSDWMKVMDLTYVENTLIPGIEAFSFEIKKLNTELNASAVTHSLTHSLTHLLTHSLRHHSPLPKQQKKKLKRMDPQVLVLS